MLSYSARTRQNRVLWASFIISFIALYACRLSGELVGAVVFAMILTIISPTLVISVLLHNLQRRRPQLRVGTEHSDLSPNYFRDGLV